MQRSAAPPRLSAARSMRHVESLMLGLATHCSCKLQVAGFCRTNRWRASTTLKLWIPKHSSRSPALARARSTRCSRSSSAKPGSSTICSSSLRPMGMLQPVPCSCPPASGRQAANSPEHFAGVALHSHLVPDFFDFAVRPNQKRAPHDSFENSAHEFFRAPYAIFFDHFVSRIAQQGKVEFLLFLEVGQSLFGVSARAQNNHI